MTIYFILFALLLTSVVAELSVNRIKPLYKIFLVLLLVGISGFRYEVGNDYNNYVFIFDHIEEITRIEPGFAGLIRLIKVLGGNSQSMFLFSSTLAILPLAFAINKFFPNYFCTALAVYVFSYTYFEGMNTVRQAISMAIMFYAFCDYLKNRKIRIYIILTAIATMFHISVIIVALAGWMIISFSGKEINTIVFAVALVASFILGYYIQEFTGQITDVFVIMGRGDSQYLSNIEQRGVSLGTFHYVLNLYAFAFLLFSYIKKKFLLEFENGILKLFLIAVITYNFFFNFYIGLRFYWYFFLMLTLVIPVFLSCVNKKSRILVFFLLISVFMAYTFVSLGTVYYSQYNYTFEFIGVR